MRRTSPPALVFLGFVAAVLGWTLESWLVSTGRSMLVPPLTLPVTLVVLAAVLLILAWPVRRYTRELHDRAERAAAAEREGRALEESPQDPSRKRVDPQLAIRVLALAKASSLTSSLIGGASVAILLFVATRPVVTFDNAFGAGASLVGAIALLVAGLLAESWCALPPSDGPRGVRTNAAPTV